MHAIMIILISSEKKYQEETVIKLPGHMKKDGGFQGDVYLRRIEPTTQL